MNSELYLSRLYLNLRSREVRRDLSDCVAMHRTIMSAFASGLSAEGRARAVGAVLYRVEPRPDGRIAVLVQSGRSPSWADLPTDWLATGASPETREIGSVLDGLNEGSAYRFRLLANPTRKVATKSSAEGLSSNGKRVGVRGEEACLDWLRRKGGQHGFGLRTLRIAPEVPAVIAGPGERWSGVRKSSQGAPAKITFAGVTFEGVLEMRDGPLFRQAIRGGIGSGKAYGFGLLSLAPAG